MPFADLPQELVDRVVDHLADDTEQLKACALTSPSFTYHTRTYLFSEVRLDCTPESPSPSPSKFVQASLEAPHIPRLVKQLHLSFDALQDPALPEVLSLFHNVQAFTLEGPSDPETECGGFRDWEDLPKSVTDALTTFLSTQPLTQLSLHTLCSFPISLLNQCPSLSTLSASEVIFDSSLPLEMTGARPTLQELDLECCIQCDFVNAMVSLTDPKGPIDVTNLHTLNVQVHDQDAGTYELLQELLAMNSGTLRSFSFNPHHHLGFPINLQHLRNLESLSLQFCWLSSLVSEPLHFLVETLATIPSNSLVSLHVEIPLRNELEAGYNFSSVLGDLDALLSGPKFSNLEKLLLNVTGSITSLLASVVTHHIALSLPMIAARSLITTDRPTQRLSYCTDSVPFIQDTSSQSIPAY